MINSNFVFEKMKFKIVSVSKKCYSKNTNQIKAKKMLYKRITKLIIFFRMKMLFKFDQSNQRKVENES